MALFLYRDKAGNEIDLRRWVELFEDLTYSRIANDVIGKIEISTAWFGTFACQFETAIFALDNHGERGSVLNMERYSTEKEATDGHDRWVEWAKKQ